MNALAMKSKERRKEPIGKREGEKIETAILGCCRRRMKECPNIVT
jgi:hypothetical protein